MAANKREATGGPARQPPPAPQDHLKDHRGRSGTQGQGDRGLAAPGDSGARVSAALRRAAAAAPQRGPGATWRRLRRGAGRQVGVCEVFFFFYFFFQPFFPLVFSQLPPLPRSSGSTVDGRRGCERIKGVEGGGEVGDDHTPHYKYQVF